MKYSKMTTLQEKIKKLHILSLNNTFINSKSINVLINNAKQLQYLKIRECHWLQQISIDSETIGIKFTFI